LIRPWQKDGACINSNVDFFAKKVNNIAVVICSECPVSEECKEYAIVNEYFGYWGNTTMEDRIEIRRSRGLPEPFAFAKMPKQKPMPPVSDVIIYNDREVIIKHGTNWGYEQHLKFKVTPCDICTEARAKHMREYRQRKYEEMLNVS